MEQTIRVLTPNADEEEQVLSVAPRLTRLDGRRVALLDNTKPNNDIFQARIAYLLRLRYPTAQVGSKYKAVGRSSQAKLSRAVVEELASSYDTVIVGMGD